MNYSSSPSTAIFQAAPKLNGIETIQAPVVGEALPRGKAFGLQTRKCVNELTVWSHIFNGEQILGDLQTTDGRTET